MKIIKIRDGLILNAESIRTAEVKIWEGEKDSPHSGMWVIYFYLSNNSYVYAACDLPEENRKSVLTELLDMVMKWMATDVRTSSGSHSLFYLRETAMRISAPGNKTDSG